VQLTLAVAFVKVPGSTGISRFAVQVLPRAARSGALAEPPVALEYGIAVPPHAWHLGAALKTAKEGEVDETFRQHPKEMVVFADDVAT
jgi:hypothetical protein